MLNSNNIKFLQVQNEKLKKQNKELQIENRILRKKIEESKVEVSNES